jgi:hypothetical protein
MPLPEFERERTPAVAVAPSTVVDAALQRVQGAAHMPAPAVNFEGVSNPVACGTCSPPDTEGDVGPNHYVEWVNTSYAIYNKTGTIQAGFPKPGNVIFAALGAHDCATQNAGDPLVLYDQLADRWVLSQFTIGDPDPDPTHAGQRIGPYFQCIAVSTTPDPAGSYCLYPYQTPLFANQANNWIFPDYGKIGMWKDAGGSQDAYFFSFAGFDDFDTSFTPVAMAVERAKTLTAGCPAAQMQWFDSTNSPLVVSNANGDGTERILPTDLDGVNLPPAGEPNYYYTPGLASDNDSIEQWEFHVDWTTPANSTFTLAHTIPVPPYDNTFSCFVPPATASTRDCIPQPGATNNKLDIFLNLGRHRIMYRAAYRNLGTHRSVVFHHAADAGTDATANTDLAGLRWYEIRNPEGTPDPYQVGTYAPADDLHRWMGSLAQDADGNIAFGFSRSGAAAGAFPSIAWAGQLFSDLSNPANKGVLTQGEAVVQASGGTQNSTNSRWGDYTHMAVDPSDDCTFYYVNEYYPATATAEWHTRVAAFTYPTCSATTAVKVLRLTARWQGRTVSIAWRSASETEALGFNLYRSAGAGPFRKVNKALIAAKRSGKSGGAAYRLVDRNVRRGTVYTYRLQIVNLAGKKTWHTIGSTAF